MALRRIHKLLCQVSRRQYRKDHDSSYIRWVELHEQRFHDAIKSHVYFDKSRSESLESARGQMLVFEEYRAPDDSTALVPEQVPYVDTVINNCM